MCHLFGDRDRASIAACPNRAPRRSSLARYAAAGLRGLLICCRLWVIATLLGIVAFPTLPTRAEDVPSPGPDLGLAREQWLEHVQETKRRVQQEAAQRRLEGAQGGVEPSQEDSARRASESVVSDDSLVPGDIIVTDKGMFVFRGQSNEVDRVRDFEPIESPVGLKAKGSNIARFETLY